MYIETVVGSNRYRIGSVASSIKYKQDISTISFDPEKYLKVQPSKFRWKEHVKTDANAAYDFGFIAEEVKEAGLDILWFGSENEPQGVFYERLPLILWSIVSSQNETIKIMQEKLTELEDRKSTRLNSSH